MNFQFLDKTMKNPYLIPGLITITTVASILLNWYGLTLGITYVLPHLFYIPIILVSYFYPRRGVLFTIALSTIYGVLVLGTGSPSPDVVISALARIVVFIVIGAVVSSLSNRLQQDAAMCLRFVSMVDSSNDAVVGKTLDGIITDWNSGAERLYGYTADEIVGRHIRTLTPSDRHDEIPQLIGRIRNGERIERYETERMTKDGRRIQVSLSLSPIKNAQGTIIGASSTAHDITEKKRMQDEILRAKNEWERTFDAVPDLIAVLDREQRIVQGEQSHGGPAWYTTAGCHRTALLRSRPSPRYAPAVMPPPVTAERWQGTLIRNP